MRIFWAVLLAVVYGIGLFTIKWLDNILPEELRASKSHIPVLIIMWVFTPVLVVVFIFQQIWKWIKDHFKITF